MPLPEHGAKPANQPTRQESDRRAAERIPSLRECLVRPQGATGAGDWHAIVYDISSIGIGIGLQYHLEPVTVLEVRPWSRSNPKPVRARVVRSTLVNFLWFHGCSLLEPLTAEELQRWVD